MNTVGKSAPLDILGLPSGDHWVRFHVEGDLIGYEVAGSIPAGSHPDQPLREPTGFVARWGGTMVKIEDPGDAWLTHINEKHLR